MKNRYWTIKYPNGWLSPSCSFGRRAAIDAYLQQFANGIYRSKTWRWHRRNQGVSVVKVQIVEAGPAESGKEKQNAKL